MLTFLRADMLAVCEMKMNVVAQLQLKYSSYGGMVPKQGSY